MASRPRPRRFGSAHAVARWACLALLTVAAGCSPHLVAERWGSTDDATRGDLRLLLERADGCAVPDLLVEVVDARGELVARFFSDEEPRTIEGLPPGRYLVRVDGTAVGLGALERKIQVEAGEVVAVGYVDPEGGRRFFRKLGKGLLVAGEVTLQVVVVAGYAALVVASHACR